MSSVADRITRRTRLFSRAELVAQPALVPASPGVYGWYFREIPCVTDTSACVTYDGRTLLYVGTAPRRPGRSMSTATLRSRLRSHLRANASTSTLRMTLGALIGLELRPTLPAAGSPSGPRASPRSRRGWTPTRS